MHHPAEFSAPADATLDPADWSAFRGLAHRMVDDTLDHLQSLRERPVWQPLPDAVARRLDEPAPRAAQGAEAAYRAYVENVLPYTNGNRHPRFFGWVQGNGTPLGMMADMLAASLNPHMAGFAQAPCLVEQQVIRWLVEVMGFPATASGVLALGGSMANVLGLAVGRHTHAGFDVREHGVYGPDAGPDGAAPRLTVYASRETHGWLGKAVELMGLGRRSLRSVPCGDDGRIDVSGLRRMLADDRARKLRPFCVIGNAGTVNTGAIDDLDALADLCGAEQLWFHVDGAFGALCRLSPDLRARVRGLERADSLAFDLHKWGYQPFDVACVLVRDGRQHRATFASTASYIAAMERGVIAGGLPLADLGIDLTRGFRALKVWMALKAHGIDGIARVIEQNVAQAQELATRVAAHPELELLAPVPLCVVCFRYRHSGFDEAALDRINQEVLLRVQESGVAVPSSTTVGGRFAIRCCFVNHRTRLPDLQLLIEAIVGAGRSAVGAAAPGA